VEYEVAISPRAFRDLNAIWAHIAEDSPVEADRFVLRLTAEAKELDSFPLRGQAIEDSRDARFVVVQSYLIVYRVFVERRKVRVLRFWHAARDLRRLRI